MAYYTPLCNTGSGITSLSGNQACLPPNFGTPFIYPLSLQEAVTPWPSLPPTMQAEGAGKAGNQLQSTVKQSGPGGCRTALAAWALLNAYLRMAPLPSLLKLSMLGSKPEQSHMLSLGRKLSQAGPAHPPTWKLAEGRAGLNPPGLECMPAWLHSETTAWSHPGPVAAAQVLD